MNFRKFIKTYIIVFIIALFIGTGVFCAVYFTSESPLYAPTNSASIATVVLLSLGGLMWVVYEGFFDIFAYGIKQIGSSIFSKKANQDNDFATYKEQNREKRVSRPKMFIPILAAGVLFLIAMIILRIVAAVIEHR